MRKMLIVILVVFSLNFIINADNNKCNKDNSKKDLQGYSDQELMDSIKSDASRMSAKFKILSSRYYEKAKNAANEGKKDASDAYTSCADSLKEMGEGFEQKKIDIVAKGKSAYKKAMDKLKRMSENFNNKKPSQSNEKEVK